MKTPILSAVKGMIAKARLEFGRDAVGVCGVTLLPEEYDAALAEWREHYGASTDPEASEFVINTANGKTTIRRA